MVFTGRVREVGVIQRADEGSVVIGAPVTSAAVRAGGSVCVDGVRLTVRDAGDGEFAATVTAETTRRSTFGAFAPGVVVNLETPLAMGDAIDGHLVQGYVDAVGKIVRVDDEGKSRRVWIRPPERLRDHLTAKTPIAVDGVSMTVAEVLKDRFAVVVLPVTAEATTLGRLEPGVRVNLELDVVTRLAVPGAAVTRLVRTLPRAGHLPGRAGVAAVVSQIAAGGAVLVWDPAVEGEADVIFAGVRLKPESFTFLLTEVCGYPCVPAAADVLERLEIARIPGPGDRQHTAFCTPVDLAAAEGTGVSAAEHAATVRRMADPAARAADFTRPGHVIPIAAKAGLLAERTGHTEATVALCVAAGLPPVGVCCELMNHDGTMAEAADAEIAALRWGLPLVELPDLEAWL